MGSLEFNSSNFRRWSLIGSRAAFGMATLELGELYDNLILLSAGTSTSAGLQRFIKAYPDRYIDAGIAEQNMLGMAAGLASEGFLVYTTTFAPFQTMRCCEQIKVNLGYMQHRVIMVGLASGVSLGTLGYTHCAIEDLSIMRSIPGITVVSPADSGETIKASLAAAQSRQSVYIRLTGVPRDPAVYDSDYEFEIGKGIILQEGTDVSIIATGTMVYPSLKAGELLANKGISCEIINMHTIKPLDREILKVACKKTKMLVTIEEHNVIGGLGSAVAEAVAPIKNTPPQIILGITDSYERSGSYSDILKYYGLTTEQIAARISLEYRKNA